MADTKRAMALGFFDGVQADIRTIASLGAYAVSAITSITMQNTIGIQSFYDLPAATVRGQVEAVVNDVEPQVVKIGMIRRTDVLQVIVDLIVKYKPLFVVYDSILRSANGDLLLAPDVLAQIRQQLLPLCSFVVVRRSEARDILGEEVLPNVHFVDDAALHGQQNAFSSAVAAFVALGDDMSTAERKACEFVVRGMQPKAGPQGVGTKLFNRFLTLVANHFRTNSDVAFYADCLNVTATYLAQVCHRVSGKSPKNIIDRQVTESIATELRQVADFHCSNRRRPGLLQTHHGLNYNQISSGFFHIPYLFFIDFNQILKIQWSHRL